MDNVLTLLATATDARLERFALAVFGHIVVTVTRHKQTLRWEMLAKDLPAIIEAATACAVTLQRVHDAGRDEWYETLWQGPMEGWSSHRGKDAK
jgi:uncharacterized membrane protein YhaH (DUF805 family)